MNTNKPTALFAATALSIEILVHPTESDPHVDLQEQHEPRPVGNVVDAFMSATSDIVRLDFTIPRF